MALWESEDIPNDAKLFLRVHRNNVRSGLTPNIFVQHGGGMSTDWEKYSTPAETRARGRKPSNEYGVVALIAERIRSVSGLAVAHTPEDDNRAHTDVSGIGAGGKQTNDRRALLFDVFDRAWITEPEGTDDGPSGMKP